jgi:hypothetical protein
MASIDFPPAPALNQQYISPLGTVYQWDGSAWIVADMLSSPFATLNGFLFQVRTLLQDTDSAGYRYTTESLVADLNQAMMDAYRMRPDLFLQTGFILPVYSATALADTIEIETQYVPAFVYYVVGLVQARDDEQNQDVRAGTFLKVFQQNLITGGIA